MKGKGAARRRIRSGVSPVQQTPDRPDATPPSHPPDYVLPELVRRRPWLPGLLLLAATFLAYQPVWHASYIWDDDTFLTKNPLIAASNGLYRFWCTTAAPDYFPMTSSTLWLEWRLWDKNPLGFHLVNVLLHAVSSLVLWRVLARLKVHGAWLAAALFALHPVNVESVAWITERKNTLAMFFFSLTLLWHFTFEDTGRRGWYAAALTAFALALLSKTSVVPLPLVLLAADGWRRGRLEWKDLWRTAPYLVMAAVLALVTVWFQYNREIRTDIVRQDSFAGRLAGAGWAVWFYLFKALVPLDLQFVYPRWSIDPSRVLSYVPGVLVIGAPLLCWRVRGTSRGRALLFGWVCFIAMLLPILGFLNIYFMRFSLVADHWQYFSILAPLALVAAIVDGRPPGIRLVISGVLLAGLGVLTWRQASIYRNPETLWRDTLQKNPTCWMAQNNLGDYLLSQNQIPEAIEHFQRALALLPDYPLAHFNLGRAYLAQGRPADAISEFRFALKQEPDLVRAHVNLAGVLVGKGNVDEAAAHLRTALILEPDNVEAQNDLGVILLSQGRTTEAFDQFQKVLELRPDFPEAHRNIAWILIREGRIDEAISHLRKAVELKPDYADAQTLLTNALLQKHEAPKP
jgi:tetratricopeptide (TPR) repeat protein